MKRSLLTVSILSLFLSGCNNEDYFAPVEYKVVSSDTIIVRDSIVVLSSEEDDSVQYSRNNINNQKLTEPATVNFSISSTINSSESYGTKVTIKDITVTVSGDSFKSVFYPVPSVEVVEPSQFSGWHSLPIGVLSQSSPLFDDDYRDVVKVPVGVTPTISVRFVYIVRTWDSNLATGFSEVYNYYSVVIPFGFPVTGGSIYHIPLSIALTCVNFDAGVSSYE